MNIKLMKNRLAIDSLIFWIFLLFMIIDFGGAFGLRYASLALLIMYIFTMLLNGKIKLPKKFLIIEGFLFVLFPLGLIYYSLVVFNIPLKQSVAEVNSFAIILVYLLVINFESKDQLLKPFGKVGQLCSWLVILTFLLLLVLINIGSFDLIFSIQKFTNINRIGFIGLKPSEGGLSYLLTPNVYYRWSMILIPSCIIAFRSSKKKFIIICLAILITTSTAIILFTILGIFMYLLYEGFINRKITKNMLIILLIIMFMAFVTNFIDVTDITKKLSSESESTRIKLLHIESALDVIFDRPSTFLFGTGIDSSFYSSGINEYTTDIEVSHINLIRQFGFIYFSLYSFYVAQTFFSLLKTDNMGRKLSFGLVAFFIAAGTNPLLRSPIFICYLALTRGYIAIHINEVNSKNSK